MLDQHVVQRLALVRYGYQLAIEQAKQPEPMCAYAVLGLHDAVEMFFQLAAEVCGTKRTDFEFMKFWEILGAAARPVEVTHKIGMGRLNKARVGMKHHGILPSRDQVVEFSVIALSFFEENTPRIFGSPFLEISMVDLVQFQKTRDKLREAEGRLVESDFRSAIGCISIAYEMLVDDLHESYFSNRRISPFYMGDDLKFDRPHFRQDSLMSKDAGRDQFEDKVIDAIERMQPAVQALSLGFDYKKYSRFALARPTALKTRGGEYKLQYRQGSGGEAGSTPSMDSCRFCLDFVTECAIRAKDAGFTSIPI